MTFVQLIFQSSTVDMFFSSPAFSRRDKGEIAPRSHHEQGGNLHGFGTQSSIQHVSSTCILCFRMGHFICGDPLSLLVVSIPR